MDLASADKEALFEELVGLLASTGSSDQQRSEMLACVMEREALMTTGIRKGVAVPHGKSDSIERMTGAIGVSKRGVEYDAFDGNPVHLVFIIVSPRRDPEAHLQVLKRLALILDVPGFVEALLGAKDPSSAFAVLEHFEDLLSRA